ncbi:MAG TPA: hypothetical protein DCQ98_18050 [Planctomycetaceae bacterium]|nr:hypothetical protein [Planctomycetaceae bacterium]HRF01806.1 DUF1449 family protein [Pirellulaceae bacterium]
MPLYELAFQGVMLPITVLLLLVVAYWLLVIVGAVGLDLFDIEIEGPLDGDIDGGVGAGENSGGAMTSALRFFHLGEVPFMILLSIFAVCWWTATAIGATLFGDRFSGLWSLVWIGPSLLAGLLMTKGLLLPTSKFFSSLDGSRDSQPQIVGRTCIVTSSEVTDTFGQAEVKIDGPPIIIDVRAEKGDLFRKGDFARVAEANPVTRTYLIRNIASEESKS